MERIKKKFFQFEFFKSPVSQASICITELDLFSLGIVKHFNSKYKTVFL